MTKNNKSLAASAVIFALAMAFAAPVQAAPKDDYCARAKSAVQKARKTYAFPGAVFALLPPGGGQCVFAVGVSDKETGRRMRAGDRMLAASIGKTIVAAVVMHLHYDGLLDIDDPISKWLEDEPFFDKLPNARKITIRQLLSHTSGLADHVSTKDFENSAEKLVGTDQSFSPRELVGFILDQKPLFNPGEGYSYTDTGYILLGMIIEKAAKRPFYELAQDFFLDPLKLKTIEPSNSRSIARLVPGYPGSNNPRGIPNKTIGPDGRMMWNPAMEWTGGGFAANALDLARWVKLYFSGKAMSYPYLAEVINGCPKKNQAGHCSYGLGVAEPETPFGVLLGHSGSIPGYRSVAFYLPDHNMAYAIQINTNVNFARDADTFRIMNTEIIQEIIGTKTGLVK
jgi:D-alanyl-D-alanine carboxypeptidase